MTAPDRNGAGSGGGDGAGDGSRSGVDGGDARLRRALDRVVARTGESAFLSTPNDVVMQVTHIVLGPQPITLSVAPGATVPMVGSAVGQAFLATRPERELAALLRRIRREAGGVAEVEPAEYRARLAVVRRRLPADVALAQARHRDGERVLGEPRVDRRRARLLPRLPRPANWCSAKQTYPEQWLFLIFSRQ